MQIKRRIEGACAEAYARARPTAEKIISRTSKHGNSPVYDNSLFPYFQTLESEWRVIRAELDAVLDKRQRLPTLQDLSPHNVALTNDQDWKVMMFYSYGQRVDYNCELCPETARLVEGIPGLMTAMFSILSPGKHIPEHRGPYNGVLRYHLGLKIPEPREMCRIAVDGKIHHWEEGEGLIFDDSFRHEVWNDTDGQRVVLFITFERPVRFPFSMLNWSMNKLQEMSSYHQEPRRRLEKYNSANGVPIQDDARH